MTAFSDFLEVELRKHIFRTGSYTKPTVLGIALYTAAPGEAGGGTEVTGGSYARIDTPPLDANWTGASATNGLTDNASDITFATPSANWGTIGDFAILDATSGGNFLFYGALTAAKTVNNGDPAPKFSAGDLDVTFA